MEGKKYQFDLPVEEVLVWGVMNWDRLAGGVWGLGLGGIFPWIAGKEKGVIATPDGILCLRQRPALLF